MLAAVLWSLASVPVFATDRTDYYAPLHQRGAQRFRDALHELIDDLPSLSKDQVVEALRVADRVPMTPSLVLDLYSAATFSATSPTPEWDREHVWPDSHGYDGDVEAGRCNVPLTDVHMEFVADREINRNHHVNRYYDDGPDCPPVGGLGVDTNHRCVKSFEVWRERRGDVARAMFYADVRYDGGANDAIVSKRFGGPRDATGKCLEPELILTNTTSAIVTTTTTTGTAYMGVLRTLLRWHFEDPVDARDGRHNEAVFISQTNRNPFIDHPDWVCQVWPDEVPCATRRYAFLPRLETRD